MSTSIGRINLDLGINKAGFKSELNGAVKMAKGSASVMTGAFGKMAAAAGLAFSVTKIVNFSKECLRLGSDLAEVQNVVDVTFGDMSESVNAFAKNAIDSYGLSEKVAKEYMGQFGAMSKAFGNTTEMAYAQSTALTGLVGDVASFYNLTTDEAFTKLKAVYTGETESLKSLGVVMTQNALDEYALQQGIGKTTKAMSEQEKVALRLSFVQDRLAAASGDFMRTSDGWANQTRVLTLRFDALKSTIGQGLINVLTPLLSILNELIAKLQLFADAFYNLTVKIFGDAGGASSGTAAAAAATGEIADNMGSAVGSAKAYKKILAGFDKLNILSSPDSGSGGSGGSGSSSSLTMPNFGNIGSSGAGYDTTSLENTLAEITALVSVATLALGAILAFSGANIPLGIGLIALGATGLAASIAVDWSSVENSIATALDLITTVVSAALLAIGAVLALSGAKPGLGIALMAAGATGLAAEAALNWKSANNEVKTAMTGIMTAVGSALLALGAILALSGVNLGLGIPLMAAGAISFVSAGVLNWNSMSDSVTSTVTTIAAIVGGALLGLGAVLAFSGIKVGLGIALMAAGAVSLASAIAPNWSSLSDETKRTISVIAGIAGGALLALGIILLATGAGIPLGLGLIAAGAASLATAIAPNWGKITSSIKSVINSISGSIESFINGIIGGINWLVRAINKIKFDVPDWVPGIGGKSVGFNLKEVSKVSIPRLATGGYVKANTPQLAVIGDNKREGEIVAPESKIAEAVAVGVASAMKQVVALMNQNRSSAGQSQPIIIRIGEDDVWSGFIDYHNSIVQRTGDSPLLV